MNPTLTWVSDVNPTIYHDEHGDRAVVEDPRLTDVQTAVVQALVDAPDEGECAGCRASIGYVLVEDDDNPSRSGWSWHFTTVVIRGAHTLLVCEDCDPDNLYAVPLPVPGSTS
jgi:hypothetical protein